LGHAGTSSRVTAFDRGDYPRVRGGYFHRSNIFNEGTASLISDTSRIKAVLLGLNELFAPPDFW
jgi:hypothetical protein